MTRTAGAEDLLVLARQDLLEEDAERRFDIAVQSSRELELLYRAGVGFDADAELMPGDELRSAALVARTLAALDRNASEAEPRAQASRGRYGGLVARALASGVLLGLLLSVALASAWEYAEKRQRAEPFQRSEATLPASGGHTPAPKSAPRAEPSAPVAAPIASESPAPRAIAAPTAASAPPRSSLSSGATVPSLVAESAEALFARANAARRSGDIEAALAQYRDLDARFPSSVEAEDSKVLIGKLLLSQRSPRAALRELESYHGEALADEALWTRAEALRKLDNTEERATLLELVRRHPDSPYAEAARKRLSELGP